MQATGAEKRKHTRTRRPDQQELRIVYEERPRFPGEVLAKLVDVSEGGIGVQLGRPLRIGTPVRIWGKQLPDSSARIANISARVSWCASGIDGTVRAGLALDNPGDRVAFGWKPPESTSIPLSADHIQDYYEVLQINPKAHPDTIQKVFRLLAQRYHPDNVDTGDAEMFKLLVDANRVLGDPEKRAAYDVQLNLHRQLRWKLFDKPQDATGVEAEKRKRQGILTMLYTKRIQEPDQPNVTMHELEEILACPKEHLQFSLWYLKENGLISRSDNGRYSITVKGVDHAEMNPYNFAPEGRLLAAPAVL